MTEIPDVGTPERLVRGDLVIVGRGRQARAFVFSVILRWPEECRDAAAWLLGLFEAARYSGYKCASLERRSGGGVTEMSGRSAGARRALNRVADALGAELWAVVWHLLFFEESAACFGIRSGVNRSTAHRRLRRALEDVAEMRRRGRL